jgi:hypothetical protein
MDLAQATRQREQVEAALEAETPANKVFSVESDTGYSAVVRADDINEVLCELEAAKRNNCFAFLERVDGEPVGVDPTKVFLVGEIAYPSVDGDAESN